MEDLERLQAAFKANSKQGCKIVTRYHKRMKDNEVAFNAIFTKIWELEPREKDAQNPFASTKDITEQAIKAVGYNLNDEIVKAFFQHEADYYEFAELDAKGIELGFEIAAHTNKENTYKERTTLAQCNEWLFYPISIFAPQQIQDEIITPLLQANSQKGEGLFANNTDIPLEDESEDDFLMIEAYNCKASLCSYWQELKDNGIIGVGKTDAFLSYLFKGYLLKLLKEVAIFIKDNTNKPSNAKNKVTATLKSLDKIPVWGLFFQILLLQGLCRWLEDVEINEGDEGYKEVQLMYKWLYLALVQKEVQFCYTPYSDKDKQKLQPLCNYLYSTGIGKEVQKCMRKKLLGEHQPKVQEQPREFDTEKARALISRAVEAGFVTVEAGRYKWNREKVLFAYFVVKATDYLGLKKKYGADACWKPFESLFNMINLRRVKADFEKYHSDFKPSGYEDINTLFEADTEG